VAAHVEHEIVVDAPMELVWEMTNDIELWITVFRECAEAATHPLDADPFEHMSISWYCEPTAEGVRVHWVQDFELKPGLSLDDAAMRDLLNRETPGRMRRIKEQIELAAQPIGAAARE